MSEIHLTKCELEIMDVVWKCGRVTVQDVVDRLERPLAYTTVMTTLKVMHTKRGVLKCQKVGRAFVYEASVSREQVSNSLAEQLSEHLHRGSVKSLVLSLLSENTLSRKDISELKRAIATLEARNK